MVGPGNLVIVPAVWLAAGLVDFESVLPTRTTATEGRLHRRDVRAVSDVGTWDCVVVWARNRRFGFRNLGW